MLRKIPEDIRAMATNIYKLGISIFGKLVSTVTDWLKDKFGLSWQVTPTVLIDMLHDDDKDKSGRVMQAMLQMSKIDIKALKDAYER